MNLVNNAIEWIRRDFRSHPLRFFAELFAWTCSVTSAIIFAVTAPNIPIVLLYSIFISGCCATAWTCYTRHSFGLLANYVFIIIIDCAGLAKMLINH